MEIPWEISVNSFSNKNKKENENDRNLQNYRN